MNDKFPNILKTLRISNGYTQKDLAKILNLAQTSIANYENGARNPDMTTLIKIADLFYCSLDYLLGRNIDTLGKCEEYDKDENMDKSIELDYDHYLSSILNGDNRKASNICITLLEKGMKINDLYENILRKSLIEVGALWEQGIVSIWQEHLITEITLDIVRILNLRLNPNKNHNKQVILLTPGSEAHNIGLRIISNIFEINSWKSIFLGSNVPTRDVLDSIEILKPQALALSITMPSHLDSAIYLIQAIRQIYSKDDFPVIIGGNALNYIENITELTGADYYFKDINELLIWL